MKAFTSYESSDCHIQGYILIRLSSFGQTQNMPPGESLYLITLVAIIAVPHCGHLVTGASDLFPRLARAVLDIFLSAIIRLLSYSLLISQRILPEIKIV